MTDNISSVHYALYNGPCWSPAWQCTVGHQPPLSVGLTPHTVRACNLLLLPFCINECIKLDSRLSQPNKCNPILRRYGRVSGCSTLLETALASPDLTTTSEDSSAPALGPARPATLVTVAPRPPPRTVLALQTSAAMAAGDRVKWVNKAAQVMQANIFWTF